MNVKLTIEYDGTEYKGWQVQPNGKTIQEILEQALEEILRKRVRLHGSGRTDSGVHAIGQVANFICAGEIDLWRLQRGLNAFTPPDIVIKKVEVVPDTFDARRDAQSRVYEYRIWNHPWPPAILRRFSYHVYQPLELPAMQEAIRALEGGHDFSSFQGVGSDTDNPMRKILHNSLIRQGDLLVYTVEANAFLRHMVRNIVGTMVEVGRGERTSEAFAELLRLRDRTRAGPTAPPQGLILVEVKY